ncbi:MAG: hypothetical protein AAFP17_08250 [Pseudomonadota bacterium]
MAGRGVVRRRIIRRLALVAAFLAFPVAADEREAFYGSWGTAKQCTRAPIKPGGTVLAAPVEIGPEWLRQGGIWCRLTWYPLERRDDGLFTAAQAQCGEDTVRDYFLRMERSGDALKLRWGFAVASGPLALCPSS